jgi:histidinol phosphatase-like PHP family hydrolase
MSLKIAILTDLHFSNNPAGDCPRRKGELADVLLLRAVHRLNRWIKPDVTFVGGDLINDPALPDAEDLLFSLKTSLGQLNSETIAMPGNHDPAPETFYKIFGSHKDIIEVKGVRFLLFLDPEEPGYNARRERHSLDRMRAARAGFKGQIVSLQHVPLFPPEAGCSPFNYTNAAEIIKVMDECGITLSLSGHFHDGFAPLKWKGCTYLTAPALCEMPFRFCVIELENDGSVKAETHQLGLPENSRLTDFHIHTRLAYCNENMKMPKALQLGQNFGLESMGFAEHSSHLYFSRDAYSAKKFYWDGINSPMISDNTEDYFSLYKMYANEFSYIGMEIDVDRSGIPVINPDLYKRLDFRIGAIHYMKSILDAAKRENEFMYLCNSMIKSGIDILAHPFRIFRKNNLEAPHHLFAPLAALLKENNVAAEINFHANEPPLEFVKLCLKSGVKLAFGSDAHNLYEVGEFYPHLKLLEAAGFNGPLEDILLKPRPKNAAQ